MSANVSDIPTTPGWYMGRYGAPDYAIIQLCVDKECGEDGPHWYRTDQDRGLRDDEVRKYYLPLVRLVPEVEIREFIRADGKGET